MNPKREQPKEGSFVAPPQQRVPHANLGTSAA